MRDSVRDNFIKFNSQFEGVCTWMYLDTHDPPLVTTGIGNLIDPLYLAQSLPWVWKRSRISASKLDIQTEWDTVKRLVSFSKSDPSFWANRSQLQLFIKDVYMLVLSKAAEFSLSLSLRPDFKDFKIWSADAQLGTLSMSWAMGTGFRFSNFQAAAKIQDWDLAAAQCKMNETGNDGLIPRNIANKLLFQNAWVVKMKGLDPSALYYPQDLSKL